MNLVHQKTIVHRRDYRDVGNSVEKYLGIFPSDCFVSIKTLTCSHNQVNICFLYCYNTITNQKSRS